jgi:hypothetical protein
MAIIRLIDTIGISLQQRDKGNSLGNRDEERSQLGSGGGGHVRRSESLHYFPSSHPKVRKHQWFGFGSGTGISSSWASSYLDGNLGHGTLGNDSPYAGREYGGVNRVRRHVLLPLLVV